MKKLNYSIEIKAPKEKVWNTMLEQESYRAWAKAFSSESQFSGEWKQGTYMNFFDPNMGGTRAFIERVESLKHLLAKHVAILDKDLQEDTESEMARKWMGAIESYTLEEDQGITGLAIEITTHEDFVKMFEDSWPQALGLLKELCEK